MTHYSPEKLLVSMMKNPPKPQKFQKHQEIHTYVITKNAMDDKETTQGKTGNFPVSKKDLHNIEIFQLFNSTCSRQKQNNLQEETLSWVSDKNPKESQCQKVL